MINRLPWRKKLRTSAANNLDKINEIIDYINHSDISPVTLSDSASGRIVNVGMSSSMKGLEVYGESVQNGVPTPDLPVPIQVVRGRNLLDESASVSGYVNASGNVNSSSDWKASDYIQVIPGKTYTFNPNSTAGSAAKGMFYNSAKEAITSSAFYTGLNTVTAPSEAAYVRVSYRIESTNVQLELGSTPTPYVPYGHVGLSVTANGTTTVTPIPLPSKGFAASLPDGTADVLTVDSAGRWEWTCNTGMKVLDGTETWGLDSNGFYTQDNAIARRDTDGYADSLLCTRFMPYEKYNASVKPDYGITGYVGSNVGRNWIYLRQKDQATANDLKTWLASNNATVYYPLATPTTESGYIDLPAIPDGATVTIEATISPEFTLDWWSYQDITDMIDDLKGYTDWKVSQIEGASTLGSNRLTVNPVVKEIAGEGKIEDEAPAELEDMEVPEEIEDTEDE